MDSVPLLVAAAPLDVAETPAVIRKPLRAWLVSRVTGIAIQGRLLEVAAVL